jgi:hypothetical protein
LHLNLAPGKEALIDEMSHPRFFHNLVVKRFRGPPKIS